MNFDWQTHVDLQQADLTGIKLISIDIFDTLLFRAVRQPSDLFLLLAERARSTQELQFDISAEQFRQLRTEAERKARQRAKATNKSDEIHILNIWEQMPAWLGNRKRLAEMELELEYELSWPNPYLIDFIQYINDRGFRWQLTSDTYFPRAFIGKLLHKASIDVSANQLLLSHEEDANKYSGTLFDVLLRTHHQLSPEQILHLGDDLVSDSVQAQTRKIKSLYLKHAHLPQTRQLSWLLTGSGNWPQPLASLNRLGHAIRLPEAKDAELCQLGLDKYGPVLAGFCCWVAFDAIKRGIKRLCPIMREARVFKPLLELVIKKFQLQLTVHEFYTSRKASFLAQLESLDSAAIAQFRNRRSYSLADMVNELELPALPAELQLVARHPLNDIPDQAALTEYLNCAEVQSAARLTFNQQRQLLREYACCIFGQEPVAMIDIGPGGNSLAWVANALGEQGAQIQCNYLMYGIPEHRKHLLDGHRFLTYLPMDADLLEQNRVINRSPEPLEILLTGRDKTTLRYTRDANGTAGPVTAEVFYDEPQLRRLEDFMAGCHRAMLHLCHLLQYVPLEQLVGKDNRRAHLQELFTLIELPSHAEATMLGSLIFDDNNGSEHFSQIVSDHDLQLCSKLGTAQFIKLYRSQWGYSGMKVRWPQGTIAQTAPFFMASQYLECFNDTEHSLLCMNLVQRASQDHCQEVIIYGAGVLGQQMLDTALQYGLRVLAVVDSNPALHGISMQGYIVQSLSDCFNHCATDRHCYLIASSAFSQAICAQLRLFYREKDCQLKLYSINEHNI